VGAGPGDPELITLRGARCLEAADVVVHDRLISMRLVGLAPARARRIDVGKSAANHPWPQSRINALLVAEARRGRRVVRLKGGDPFVFGRGSEECQALVAAGIPFEVVPGVSSANGALACAGIPVTHRGLASGFTVVTGHRRAEGEPELEWDWLARAETLVVLMGHGRMDEIARELIGAGRSPRTAAAAISRGSTGEHAVVRRTLAGIAAAAADLPGPVTLVVGPVAALADTLAWFDPRQAARAFESAPEPRTDAGPGERRRQQFGR